MYYKCVTYSIILGGFIMWNSFTVMADYANPHYERIGKLMDASRSYREITHKDPTYYNLMKSLEIKNADGYSLFEVQDAIDILLLKDIKTREVVDKIIRCHDNNFGNWGIRLKCGEYLIKLDVEKTKGIEFLHLILNDPNMDISARILAADTMIKAGNLEGYFVIKDGLLSKDYGAKINAIWLLKRFVPYDGKLYNEEGDKVDVKGLIDSVKDKMTPGDYNKMMNIVFPK